jgi:ribosomal protein S4E
MVYDGATVMPADYKWREIVDLPEDVRSLTNNELQPLHKIWVEQRDTLADQRVIEEFNQQLRREWAIETGSIEGVYVIDRGVTQTLIEHGINASLIPHQVSNKTQEHVAMIIQDHAEVLEGLFDFVKGERALTTGYIKELHAALLRHQDTVTVVDQFGRQFEKELQKGAYKITPNNPKREDGSMHEYCPPEHVASEMDRLVAWHQSHIQRAVPPEVEAAWLHHAFTQIHPFEDGNGRVARAISSLILIKAGWFPLVIKLEEKAKYIDALESADAGDLRPLISMFTAVQRRLFLAGFDLAYRVRPPETIDAAVASARDLLIGMGEIVPKEWLRAKEVAHNLYNRTAQRVGYAAGKLQAEIASVRPGFGFGVAGGNVSRNGEITRVAGELHYSANLSGYHQLVELTFKTSRSAVLVVSFHEVGASYRGIIGVSALFQAEGEKAVPVCDEFFQINYEEEQSQAEARFDPWLEKSIVRGLALWQRTILGEVGPH